MFIGLLIDSDEVYWGMLTVFILSMVDVGSTWKKSLERFCATVGAVILAISITAMFPQSPGALLVSFTLLFAILLYLSQVLQTSPYAAFLGSLTLIIIISAAWDDPGAAVSKGLDRCTQIAIAVITTALVSRLLWPQTAEARLNQSLSERLARADTRLNAVAGYLESATTFESSPKEPPAALSNEVSMLKAAMSESIDVRKSKGTWLGRVMVVKVASIDRSL